MLFWIAHVHIYMHYERMKAAIIQHTPSSPYGSTLEFFIENQIETTIYDLKKEISFPRLNDFDVLVICGGGMNVDEEEKFPWLMTEKKLIKDAISANKKMIGLCLGGQLIAEVLGARVSQHPHWENGWQNVQLDCPLTPEIKNLTVFQWHGYSFDTPVGAKKIASNEACEHQAFMYGENVIGFQFHPETTLAWATECAEDKDQPAPGKYVQTPEQILNGNHHQTNLQKWYFEVLSNVVFK